MINSQIILKIWNVQTSCFILRKPKYLQKPISHMTISLTQNFITFKAVSVQNCVT